MNEEKTTQYTKKESDTDYNKADGHKIAPGEIKPSCQSLKVTAGDRVWRGAVTLADLHCLRVLASLCVTG